MIMEYILDHKGIELGLLECLLYFAFFIIVLHFSLFTIVLLYFAAIDS